MRIQLYKNNPPAPGDDRELDFSPYLDTFLINSVKNPLGAVLVLPGGGYHHRAKHEGDPIAQRFNELGYHAFTLQYRVAPYAAPAALEDVVRAIKIIRANAEKWCIAPDKIAVCGFSAGGHLAACSGLAYNLSTHCENDEADEFSGKADAMLLCYGVLSTTKTYIELGRPLAPGSNYCYADGKVLDPVDLVDAATPPAYIWHTATDKSVPVACAIEFAQKMWQNQNTCELHIYPQGPHGRGLGLGFPDIVSWSKEAATFLESRCNFPRAVFYN